MLTKFSPNTYTESAPPRLQRKEPPMTACRSRQGELERLSRALRTLSGSNHALLRAEAEPALLHEICRVIVEDAGYRMAMVSRVDHDERKSITPLAQVGSREAFDSLN